MILCYSGTGNSRYIAKRIAQATQDEIIDLNARIKSSDTMPVETGADVILVTPTYAWRVPRVVSEWLEETELVGAKRIWFVMNCGSEIGNAAKYNLQNAQGKALEYMGTAQVIMPENYIALFNAPDQKEAEQIVTNAEPDIDNAIQCIIEGRKFGPTRRNLYDCFMSGPVNPIFYRFIVKAKAFRVDDRCTGCGLCAEKCPLNNIEIRNGKPVWGDACTHCMACICYCPAEAIEYGKRSVGKPRYRFDKTKVE